METLSLDNPSLRFDCLFPTRKSRSNYHALKIFKTKPLCDFFLRAEQNELSMNLGETFSKFQKSIQESSGFSFSKLFTDDLNQGDLICLLV